MSTLRDAFGRQLHYLRLSITDRCNFRCAYCLPQGCPKETSAQPMSGCEIERLVRAFAALGFWKVRLTGGEATTRHDVCEVVQRIAAIPGVTRIGLTTNGYRLAAIASELRGAGLTSLNVSLDSLEPERFERITGSSRLASIVAGVEAAVAAGIPSVKVNVVLLRGMEDGELDRFLEWTRRLPLAVRFIELMQTGENGEYFRQHHLPAEEIRQKLEARAWIKQEQDPGDGPATNYRRSGHAGLAGIIAPYSAGFCDSCNRLRVSSTGNLRLCLFGDAEIPLRHLLESDHQRAELIQTIESSVQAKPAEHLLREGRSGRTGNLASTGG
jgi:cyclic pyranopterin phosphate synthase